MFLRKMFDFKNIIDNELYKKEFMEFSKRYSITRIEFENIFENAKNNERHSNERVCLFCEKHFIADSRNLKRGWGIFCSKSCSQRNINHLRSLNPLDRKLELRNKKLTQLGIL